MQKCWFFSCDFSQKGNITKGKNITFKEQLKMDCIWKQKINKPHENHKFLTLSMLLDSLVKDSDVMSQGCVSASEFFKDPTELPSCSQVKVPLNQHPPYHSKAIFQKAIAIKLQSTWLPSHEGKRHINIVNWKILMIVVMQEVYVTHYSSSFQYIDLHSLQWLCKAGTIACWSISAKIANSYRMLTTVRYYSECCHIH